MVLMSRSLATWQVAMLIASGVVIGQPVFSADLNGFSLPKRLHLSGYFG